MEGRTLWRVILPAGLIFLGLALLCSNLGIVPGLWDFLVGLWPLLLIGIGAALLLGWRGWNWRPRRSMPVNEPLGDVQSATLDLSGRVGELSLEAAGPNSHDLLGGKAPEGSRAEVEASGQSVQVRIRRDSALAWLPFGGWAGEWDLHLHPNVSWSLRVAGDTNEAKLDLANLRVTELKWDGQADNVKLMLPQRGQTEVRIGGRLGDLTVRVPQGVAGRIHQAGGNLGSYRVDTVRFPLVGDIYESPDFESATDRVEIWLDGPLGDLRIQ